ncbi:hypothetical protein HYH03_014466 [Edaphochlamys debaryana]|uniref:Uncharacterized protein n=1 Tax=Edaphochlamys debaryana TaxID=47281 RepID=A0A835XL79_9CHLO|nr:hypothetical protein HYH03_014466 [Edaphochlamys debaryana]|eukprot:KAG2486872.1 hypothetical protein HYH03_014466 [Edaphochlamys debaryana]
MQHAEHGDVYQAAFAMLGTQNAESYESLAKVLPSIKDGLADAKELIAMKVLREMKKPHMDRLRAEYEEAAAQEDAEDLSTEEGDWLDASGQPGAAGEEDLDDEGIPVVKLTRPSSSFILDGPGDVKVDNFTPEGEAEAEAFTSSVSPGRASAAALSTSPLKTDSAAVWTLATAVKANETSAYVPSIITRGAATVPGLRTGAGAVIKTVEDELRAMRVQGTLPGANVAAAAAASANERAAAAAAAARAGPLPLPPRPSMLPCCHDAIDTAAMPNAAASSARPSSGMTAERSSPLAPNDEDPEIIIMEAPSAPASMLVPGPSASGAGVAPSGLNGSAGAGADGVPTAASAVVRADSVGEDCSALPGACVDTSAEDAVWAAMQGVDGAALLEHMGLSGEQSRLASAESEGEDEDDVGPQEPLANCQALVEEPGGSSSGSPAAGMGPAAGVSQPMPVASSTVEAEPGPAPASASGAYSGSNAIAALARRTTASSDGPTFEVVETFSLDPDFDYDNVELTPREFPYTMLNMRGAGGQVPPGAPQRR